MLVNKIESLLSKNFIINPSTSYLEQINFFDTIIEIVTDNKNNKCYTEKLFLYDKLKVKEYWIIDFNKNHIFIYKLPKDNFDLQIYDLDDDLKTTITKKLQIDI